MNFLLHISSIYSLRQLIISQTVRSRQNICLTFLLLLLNKEYNALSLISLDFVFSMLVQKTVLSSITVAGCKTLFALTSFTLKDKSTQK